MRESTRPSPRGASTASPPSTSVSASTETRRSHAARGQRHRWTSSTTLMPGGGRGRHSRTRMRASCSSPPRRAGSWPTSAAGITRAAGATARSSQVTHLSPWSPPACAPSCGESWTSLPACSSTSASPYRRRWRLPLVFADERAWMVDRQLQRRGIADERVLAAMGRVPRELFVPPELREVAYSDAALPIGDGQTISQPYMAALLCEQLALQGTERVLDVGTGSGYQAAVLAELAGEVHTIERIPKLAERARANLAAAGYEDRVHLHLGDGTLGVPECRPFAASAVAAAALEAPPALYQQLEPRGRLVVPVGSAAEQWLEVV